jgi:hypothetical protein
VDGVLIILLGVAKIVACQAFLYMTIIMMGMLIALFTLDTGFNIHFIPRLLFWQLPGSTAWLVPSEPLA